MYESRNTASENIRTQIRALVDEGELDRRRDPRRRSSQSYGGARAARAAGVGVRRPGVGAARRRRSCAPSPGWRSRSGAGGARPADADGPDRRRPRAASPPRSASEDAAPPAEPASRDERVPDEPGSARRARGRAAVPAALAARPRRRAGRRRRRPRRLRDAARRLHQAGRRRAARHRGGQGGAAGRAVPGAGRRRSPSSPSWCWSPSASASLVARSSGQRTAGDTITGGVPGARTPPSCSSQARALLGVDPRAAQDAYEQVLDRDPENPEALTYSGWLLFIASAGASDELRDVAVATAQGAAGQGRRRRRQRTPTRTASSPSSPPTPTATRRRPAPRPTHASPSTRPPRSARSSSAVHAASLGSTPTRPTHLARLTGRPRVRTSAVRRRTVATEPSASGASSTQIAPCASRARSSTSVPRRTRRLDELRDDVAVAAQHGAVGDLVEQREAASDGGALGQAGSAMTVEVERARRAARASGCSARTGSTTGR